MTRRPYLDHDAATARAVELIQARLVAEGECLVYTGHHDNCGYGRIAIKRKNYKTSRVVYAYAHGPIPPGLVVMHTCDNPPCCNLDHLRLGTQADNVADARAKGRSRAISDVNRAKTHCKAGHPFAGANLMVSSDGKRRYCRECKNQRKRAARTPVPPRTHCKRGHEFAGYSVILRKRAHGVVRECRTCANDRDRQAYQRERAARQTLNVREEG